MPIEKNRKKKKKFFTLFLFVLLAFLLFNFFFAGYDQALAADAAKVVKKVDSIGTGLFQGLATAFSAPLFIVFNTILYAVFGLMGVLLIMAGVIFDWAINPGNFEAVMKMESIYKGWTIVRDFLNLAFILVLLYSAFCTVLQIEKYNLKKIILTLVLMALLVNFSFPVARFIIDTSNVTMYYIVGKAFPWVDNESGLSTSIIQFSGIIIDLLPGANCSDTPFGKVGCFFKGVWNNLFDAPHVTVQLMGAILYMFLLAITLMVIGVLLIIRIVVLAILIIFSPVGFVAPIFPSTKNFGDMWWDNLFKQAFFGPVMAFMLYISLFMMKDILDHDVGGMANFTLHNLGKGSPYSNIIVSGVMMTIPLVLLWTGLIAAQKIGAMGASAVIGKASKIANWPAQMLGKGAKYAAMSGLKKFDRDVLMKAKGPSFKFPAFTNPLTGKKHDEREVGLDNLSPRAFVEGWKRRAAEVEKKAMEPAVGGMQDKLNLTLGKEKTNYRNLAIQRNIVAKEKEAAEVSENSDSLMQEFVAAREKGDYQKMSGIMRVLFKNNDQNEMIKWFGGKEGQVNPEDVKRFIRVNLTKAAEASGMTHEEAEDVAVMQATDMSEMSFAKGNYGNYGMTTYDKIKKKMRFSESDHKIEKTDEEGNIVMDAAGNVMYEEEKSADGETPAIDEKGNIIYKTIDEQAVASVAKGKLVESQSKMKGWHWNTFFQENASKDPLKQGSTGKLHNVGKAQLEDLTMSEVNQGGRVRKDFVIRLTDPENDSIGQIRAHAKEVAARVGKNENENRTNKEKAKIINAFADRLLKERGAIEEEEKEGEKGEKGKKGGKGEKGERGEYPVMSRDYGGTREIDPGEIAKKDEEIRSIHLMNNEVARKIKEKEAEEDAKRKKQELTDD